MNEKWEQIIPHRRGLYFACPPLTYLHYSLVVLSCHDWTVICLYMNPIVPGQFTCLSIELKFTRDVSLLLKECIRIYESTAILNIGQTLHNVICSTMRMHGYCFMVSYAGYAK